MSEAVLENAVADRSETWGYFVALAEYCRDLLNRAPISRTIEPLADTFSRLQPALERGKPAELVRLRELQRPGPNRVSTATPAGMNTIGILCDRLAILVCKEWYLHHRQHRPAEAAAVRDMHIPDIVAALAQARPGHARLLEKVTTQSDEATAASFEEAFYGVLTWNLLIWETQELLYTRDMEHVVADELRDYIRFFSRANRMRNGFITACETYYWLN